MADSKDPELVRHPERSEGSKKTRLIIFIVVIAVLGSIVFFFSTRLESKPSYTGGKVLGKQAPDVSLKTLDGKKISLSDYKGKTIMVNFFNSWCIPCQEEEPALLEFSRQMKDKDPDFVFIGIVRDDSEKNIRNWAKDKELPFIVAFDDNENAAISFGTTGQPETYVINSSGQVVGSLLSRASVQTLNQMWEAAQ